MNDTIAPPPPNDTDRDPEPAAELAGSAAEPPMPDWLRGAVEQIRTTPVPPGTPPALDFRP